MQVHKLFSPLEEDVICKRTDSGGMLIDFAHLIESNSVAKYQNRYGTATRHFKDCHVIYHRTMASVPLHARQAAHGFRRQLSACGCRRAARNVAALSSFSLTVPRISELRLSPGALKQRYNRPTLLAVQELSSEMNLLAQAFC